MKVEDIEYVLEALGMTGSTKRSGDHLRCNCVNAHWAHESGVDTGRKMGVLVQPGKALVNCFYPGCFKGTLLGLVNEVGGKRVKAKEMTPEQLSDLKAFIALAEEEGETDGFRKTGPLPIPQDIIDALGSGSDYWGERGASQTSQQVWQLGEGRGRALLPLVDRAGVVRAVQGRLLPGRDEDDDGHEEKYRTWPVGFEKDVAFGDHLTADPKSVVILVESPFDAVLLTQWIRTNPDFDDACVLALMGSDVREGAMVNRILSSLKPGGELVLAFDGDNAGRLGQRKLSELFYARVANISEVQWLRKDPSDDDDGEASLSEVRDDALAALVGRSNWLTTRLNRLLTP